MIVDLILVSISVIISIFAIIYFSTHRENYGTKHTLILMILIYLIGGICYFTTFGLSSMTFFEKDVALILWKISMIIRIPAMLLLFSLRISIIDSQKAKFTYISIISFLGGLIVGLLFLPNSFEIMNVEGVYIVGVKNIYFLIFNLLYDVFLIVFMIYILLKTYYVIGNKKLFRTMVFGTLITIFIILTNTLYLITQNLLYRYLHLVVYLVSSFVLLIIIVKKPEQFIDFSNKIYNFIIFHRSGILLYNYYVKNGNEADDSLLKGSILIGINHILLNFINKKDQLNLISLRNQHDILLEYDNELNYAILLVVRRKDVFIDKAVQLFMNKFSKLNEDKLLNLNGLIDTSVFKNTGEIIKEYFKPFLRFKNSDHSLDFTY